MKRHRTIDVGRPCRLALLGFVLLAGASWSHAGDISQIKIGSLSSTAAPTTTQANAYYSASTVSTREIWGPDPSANRPAEIKELARALRNNVDLIYEYVHDNVRTTFMYGLQKGALGALIDQSGTPFDQAELMVELLRESGYSARYKVGTLLVSTAQANSWIGSSDTSALQQMFRDGGFPLNFSGGNFTIGHAWVEVTIPGSTCNTTCWFDPSYKTYTFKSTLANLPALMGITNPTTEFDTTTSGNFFMQSWVGLQKQTTAADPVWVSNVNGTNLQTKVQGYASALLTNLKTAPYNTYEIDDVVGGQQINKTGGTPVRNNGTLPTFTTAVQRTWDCTDNTHCGVPDAYRTLLTVTVTHQFGANPIVINKPLFADEVYGRRLYLDVPLNVYEPDKGGPGSWEPFCIKLTVDGTPLTDTASNHTVVGCTGSMPYNPLQRKYRVRLEVDHPYAGPVVSGSGTGTYMDLSAAGGTATERDASLLSPVIIVTGFGDVSPALVSKLASGQHDDRLFPVVDPYPGDGMPYEPGEKKGSSSMDHTMVKLGASYLAQYSQMAELQKRLGKAEHVMHHQIGLVYSIDDPENGWSASGNPDPPNTDNEWAIRDRAIRINVDGAISVNSKTNISADRQKVIHATLAAAATLEGSLFEQMLDNWATASTANRFQWGNQNISGMKFYLYRPTSPAPGGGFGSDATSAGCTPPGYAGLTFGGPNALPDYVNATKGFWAIVAADQCLGPGNRFGLADEHTGFGVPVPSLDRGRAFVAFQPDSSSVAHVVTSTTTAGIDGTISKGGGAAMAPSYSTEFSATGVASLLKDKFDDKSRLNGIDLNTGDLTYSAPPDITVGEGGFPYELSLQRTFAAGASKSLGLPEGWTHNLDVQLSSSGDGLAKMGRDSAQAAAESIAAIYVAQQIYSVAPTLDASTTPANLQSHLKRWVLAPFVMQWWGTKLNYNVVTINAGHDARQFTKMADGLFAPPRNGVGTLTQTGARTLHVNIPIGNQWGETTYDFWDYSGVSFTYTSPEKDVQAFQYYSWGGYDPLYFSSEHDIGSRHGWRLSTWTFPYGVTVTYTYASTLNVSNNLGRSLTLSFGAAPDLDDGRLTSVTDGQGRTVTYSHSGSYWRDWVLASVNSPESANGAEVTKYQYIGGVEQAGGTHNTGSIPAGARPQIYTKLWQVFAPSDGTYPKMKVDYDLAWRAKTFADAIAIKTPASRNPYSYFVTGTSRGERADPLGNLYTVYYDDRGRAIQFVDEENRAVNQTFDNHDRVAQRTFPEGNSVQFAYDDLTQQIKTLTQHRKSSTYWSGSDADIVVQATYDTSCRRIKTVTDAKLKVTTWNYNATTCTLTSVQQPQVANPEAGGAMTNPLTQYLYNSFGQMTQLTDPTGRIVTFEYDATSKYRWKRHVNPASLNLTTIYGHDAYGDINSVTDPRSNVTNFTYDKVRRLKQVDAPLSATTVNLIDLDGDIYQVKRAKDAAHTQWQVWQKTFTPTKKTDQETSPTNEITTYTYDALDRTSVMQDPDGRKVQTQYFRDGATKQIVKAFQSASMTPIVYATYALTPNGQIDNVTDANGNVTNLNYDAFDRLHRTFYPDPSTGAPCSPALPHSTTAPSCGAGQKYEGRAYDANGNVVSKRNRDGQSITLAFDDMNRETTRTVPANPLGHFARTLTSNYDLASRKYDLTADAQTLSHRYDAAGRLSYVDDTGLPVGSRRVTYGYDAADNRTSVAYPGGTSALYAYDALNRLDTVTEGGVTLADYDWDLLSRRDLVKYDNNAFTSDPGYEDDDDLSALVNTGPAPLTFTLGRNHSSQITSLAASDGAFLARPTNTATSSYVSNKLDQYTTVAGVAQSYDANGNLISDGANSFEFDEENRLRSAAASGMSATYEYDPVGRRRAKIVNGVSTRYVSEGAEEIEERDSQNTILRKYVYGSGADERIAMLDSVACVGGGRCFYLTNWQGSTTTLVNQSGTLNAVYHYGPYGEGFNWTPADALTGNPFRYTGRRVDPETGLYYFRARYYSAKDGRFLQVDPIGTGSDLDLYAYVHEDPLNRTDPTGYCDMDCPFIDPRSEAIRQESFRQAREGFIKNTQFSVRGYGDAGVIVGVGGEVTVDGRTVRDGTIAYVAPKEVFGVLGAKAGATGNMTIGPKHIGDVTFEFAVEAGLLGATLTVGESGVNFTFSVGPQIGVQIKSLKSLRTPISGGVGEERRFDLIEFAPVRDKPNHAKTPKGRGKATGCPTSRDPAFSCGGSVDFWN